MLAVVVLVGSALAFRPPAPAPPTPEQSWAGRATGPLSKLAHDVAAAARQAALAPATAAVLRHDVADVEAAGVPSDAAVAILWRQALADVTAAADHPTQAGAHLAEAGLELTTVEAGPTGPAR